MCYLLMPCGAGRATSARGGRDLAAMLAVRAVPLFFVVLRKIRVQSKTESE